MKTFVPLIPLFLMALAACSSEPEIKEDTAPAPGTIPPTQMITQGGPEYADLKGKDPAKVLAAHLDGGDYFPSERLQVRTWLARYHDDSAAGLFGKAWLYSLSGDEVSAKVLLERCVAKDSRQLGCIVDLIPRLKGNDTAVMALWQKAQDGYPDVIVREPRVLINVFETLTDRSKANNLLDLYEPNFPDWYVFEYLRGVGDELAGDPAAALVHVRRAMVERKGARVEVAERYVRLAFDHGPDRAASTEVRISKPVGDVLGAYGSRRTSAALASAIRHTMANMLAEKVNAPRDVLRLQTESFQRFPNEDAVVAAFDAVAGTGLFDAKLKALLDDAAKKLAVRPGSLEKVALFYTFTTLDAEFAGKAFAAALASCRIQSECDRIAESYNWFHGVLFDENGVVARKIAAQAPFSQRGVPGLLKYRSAFFGRDLDKTMSLLAAGEGTVDPDWLSVRRAHVTALRHERDRAAAIQARTPFLAEWEKTHGDAALVTAPFGKNSAKLAEDAGPSLQKVADWLKKPGAEGVIFTLEGVVEPGKANKAAPLARKRVATFAAALINDFEVPPERFRVQDSGLDGPAPATEDKAILDGTSNRIRIAPEASLRAPVLAGPGTMDARWIDASPDGRLLVAGRSPMVLWDAARNVRLGALGQGDARRFSPDGRMVAAVSNWSDGKKNSFHTVRIFDVRSGRTTAQIPFPFAIEGPSWDPKGARFVVSDSQGFFYVIDARTGKRKTMRMGNTTTGGRAIWLRDGTILTAHPTGLRIWDVAASKPITAMDGVAGVTTLGQSGDGRHVAAALSGGKVVIWDASTWTSRTIGLEGAVVSRIAGQPGGGMMALRTQDGVVLLDARSGKISGRFEVAGEGVFSSDGGSLMLAEGLGTRVLTVKKGAEVRRIGAPGGMGLKAVTQDAGAGVLKVTSIDGTRVWNVTTGQVTAFEPVKEGEEAVAAGLEPRKGAKLADGGRVVQGMWGAIERRDAEGGLSWTRFVERQVASIQVFEKQGMIALVDVSGWVELRRLSDFDLLATLLPGSGAAWLAVTPSGHMAASDGGTKGVGWSVGTAWMPFSLARAPFVDAGKVAASLKRASGGGKAGAVALDAEVFRPPYAMKLKTRLARTSRKPDVKIKFTVSTLAPTKTPYEVRFWVNGQPAGTVGPPSEPVKSQEHPLTLPVGEVTIKIALHFQGLDLQTQTLTTKVPEPRK